MILPNLRGQTLGQALCVHNRLQDPSRGLYLGDELLDGHVLEFGESADRVLVESGLEGFDRGHERLEHLPGLGHVTLGQLPAGSVVLLEFDAPDVIVVLGYPLNPLVVLADLVDVRRRVA